MRKQGVRGVSEPTVFPGRDCGRSGDDRVGGLGAGRPGGKWRIETRIRLVFSHHHVDSAGKQSEPGWPYLGYDCEGRKRLLLEQLRTRCPGFEFLPTTAFSAEDGLKLLAADKEVDGYLAYMIGGWATAGQAIAKAGKSVIYVGDLYGASGEILTAISEAKRRACAPSASRRRGSTTWSRLSARSRR